MEQRKLIDCKALCLEYENRQVVKDATFTVLEGDYISVLGQNGSGKSTLIKGLLGLKKQQSGTIKYENIEARQIGYLPQQTVVQKDFPATVDEVVLSGCLNKSGILPFYTLNQRSIAKSNMKKLNLSEIAKKSYRELSGGQQQRVLLARALCATQKLLLLDEPVTGLDPVARSEFYDIIEHLNKKHSITVIMITHDINNALKYSNKILHMNNHVEFFGSKDDYFATKLCAQMTGGKNG